MLENILKLALIALFPIALTAVIYILDKKTAFSKISYFKKQIIIGVLFGICSIIGSEFGVKIEGITMNVRDASPICAGLIFGWPAGIIAGLMGGIERYIAVSWGAGAYTQIACSVSTVLAGLLAAWLRADMFHNKRPKAVYGLATGLFIEVVHMLMVLITHINDPFTAFNVIQICTIPMVTVNSLAVFVSFIIVYFLDDKETRRVKSKTLAVIFQRSMFVVVLICYIASTSFLIFIQKSITEESTQNKLEVNITDIVNDVRQASDDNLLKVTKLISNELNTSKDFSSEHLTELEDLYEVSEISIVNNDGIIFASSNDDYINFDMHTGTQSQEFLVLLDDTDYYVQSYQSTSRDSYIKMKYAGAKLDEIGFIQVGYNSELFQSDISNQVANITQNRHIEETGYLIIVDSHLNIVSDPNGNTGKSLAEIGGFFPLENIDQYEMYTNTADGQKNYAMFASTEGYYIIAILPFAEANSVFYLSIYTTTFMQIIIYYLLFCLIFILIDRQILINFSHVQTSLAEIAKGNLDIEVNIRIAESFSKLSDSINTTVNKLKQLISEAEHRMEKDLETASTIQNSVLPSVFPAYPSHKEFDLWAGMFPAKEVGGDFYDFFFVHRDQLAIMVSDVSGKGIPAAMFMMNSKSALQSYAYSEETIASAYTKTNDYLTQHNEAGMFITSWMAYVDLHEGKVSYVNAGHNPPLIRHKNGNYEYLKSRAGFVLAGMPDYQYKSQELQLEDGSEIFVYTDGVTEATNANNELFGEERLLESINKYKDLSSEEMCKAIKADIAEFVGDAPQFDDITMLSFKIHYLLH